MICIPKEQAQILKQALAEKRVSFGEIVSAQYTGKVAIFEQFVPRETAQYIATQFEVAIGTKRADAVKTVVRKVFSGREVTKPDKAEDEKVKKQEKDIIDKVNEVQGAFTAASVNGFVDQMVQEKLGMELNLEQVATIDRMAKELRELSEKENDKNPYNPVDEYFVKRDEMEKYLQSINPQTPMAVFFGTIAPGNLLAALSAPFLNIVSSVPMGVAEAVVMRITNLVVKQKLVGDPTKIQEARPTASFANEMEKLLEQLDKTPTPDESVGDYKKIYRYATNTARLYAKSGIDVARVTDIGSDQKVLGEERQTAQGEGTIRAWGRFTEQVVFRYFMGVPDAFFAGLHVADSTLMSAKQMADMFKLEGKKRQQFIDYIFDNTLGMKTVGQSEMLQAIKMKAISHALLATYQNDSKAADIFLSIRNKLDEYSGDVKAGKFFAPFVKTPVNVYVSGLEYAGLGVFTGGSDFIQFKKTGNPAYLYTATQKAIRSGFGLVFAAAFAFLFMGDDDEYVPAYGLASRADKALARDTGASYDSVKLDNVYVGTAFFGQLAPAIVMFATLKKALKSKSDAVVSKAIQGMMYQTSSLPYFSVVNDVNQSVGTNISENATDGETFARYVISAADQIIARTIPAIFGGMAQATDNVARKSSYNLTEGIIDNIQKRIPGLSQFVDARLDTFGNEVPGRERLVDGLMQIFGGARLRRQNDDPVITALQEEFSSGVKTSLITTKLFDSSAIKKYVEQNGDIHNDRIASVVGDQLYADIAYILLDEIPQEIDVNLTSELRKAKREYQEAEVEEKGNILNSVRDKAIKRGIKDLEKEGIQIRPKKE